MTPTMHSSMDILHRLSCACIACAYLCVGGIAQQVLQSFPLTHVHEEVRIVGDLDGDGVHDVAIIRRAPDGGLYQLDVLSARSGQLILQLPHGPDVIYQYCLACDDVDGDGRDDIAVYEYWWTGSAWTSRFVVYGGVSGLAVVLLPPTATDYLVAVTDVNGDGKGDYIMSDAYWSLGTLWGVGKVTVLDGWTLQTVRVHQGTYQFQGLRGIGTVGDMDGDGVTDYLLFDSGMQANPVLYRVISGVSGVQVGAFPKLSYSWGLSLRDMGDWNGDGYDDLVLMDHGNPPYTSYRRTQILGGPGGQLLWESGTLWSNPVSHYFENSGRLGDLDGDGYADVLLGNGGPVIVSGRSQAEILRPPLFDSAGGQTTMWPGLEGPGDVNDDGVPDFFVLYVPNVGQRSYRLLSGAAPGVDWFANGCADQTGRVPRIGVGVGARLGKTMTVNLSDASPALLTATLGLGVSDTMWGSATLPIDLGAIGLTGCSWHVSVEASFTMATTAPLGGRRRATYELAVPNVASLVGAQLFGQWFILESGPSGLTGSTTKAIRVTVQP